MKKILVLLLILIPIVYTQDQQIVISLSREDYTIFETFQAEIFFNINPVNEITVSNFVLTDKLNNKIPVALFLNKISNNYYFVYFNLPNLTTDRYNFNVVNIRYIDKNLKQISVSKSFNLENINVLDKKLLSSVSINPAIINTQDIKLEIKNNFDKLNLTIQSPDYLNLPNEIVLDKTLTFNIKIPANITKDNIRINYDTKFYLIPILLEAKEETQEIVEIEPLLNPPRNSVVFLNSSYGTKFPEKIRITKDSTPNNPFYILNKWDFTIRNITFLVTGNLKDIVRLNLTNVNEIKSNETIKQYIWINEKKNPNLNNYNGNVAILHKQEILNLLPLNIEFIEKFETRLNETKVNETTEVIPIVNKTIVQEKEEKKKSKLPLIITSILILIIIIVLIFLATRKKEREPFEEFLHGKR